MKKNEFFKEFTLVNPNPYCEVMVHINESGKITDLYCYADNIPHIYNDNTNKDYKISVKKSENPLFVHINSPANIYKLMLKYGFIFAGLDDTDEQYDDDIKLIEKSLSYYNIENITVTL